MKNSLILFSLFFFFSCTKFGKNLYISGRVINPVTNQGIPNIEVELLKGKSSLPGGWTGVKSVHTDENGRFEISHLGGTSDYVTSVRAPSNLYQLGWITGSGYNLQDFGLKVGKKYNIDFHAVPYGEEVIHYNNINCIGIVDTLKQYFDGSYIPYANVQIGLYGYVTGCVDVTTNPVRFPMGERYYHWEVIRNGVVEAVIYDTIFIQPNQVNTLEIIY